jgi:hypothetical protein
VKHPRHYQKKEDLKMFTPETIGIILGHIAEASSTIDDTSDAICLKNAKGVLILVKEYTAGGDTDLILTVHEGSTAALAAAGGTVLAATFPIWTNLSALTTDAWTRQTDAAGYTIDATTATPALVAMYISADKLTEGNSWIALGTSGGHAGNLADVTYFLDRMGYEQAAIPTAIA